MFSIFEKINVFWKKVNLGPFKRWVKWFTVLALIAYFSGYAAFQYLFSLTFRRDCAEGPIRLYRHFIGELGRRSLLQYQIELDWMLRQKTEIWHVKTEDHLRVDAYFLRQPKNCKRIVMLAHGLRGQPLQVAHLVNFYYTKLHYHVLLPTARAHGSSEGNLISFGLRDHQDYQRWFAEVLDEFGEDAEIILHGVSMGGATVLMAGAECKFQQVKAIVSDCSFSSLEEVMVYQFPPILRKFGIWLLGRANYYLQHEGQFSLSDINIAQKVSKIQIPVLFIHGTEDKLIPFEMAAALYNACPNNHKQQLIVPKAGHALSWFVSPNLYEATVHQFLNSVLKKDRLKKTSLLVSNNQLQTQKLGNDQAEPSN